MLRIHTYKPAHVVNFVKSIDYLDFKNLNGNQNFAMLPLGTVQIIFQFETSIAHHTAFSKGWEERPNIFVGGPYDQAYLMKVTPQSKILSITFYPSKFKYFSSIPTFEIKNQLIHPSEIWGRDALDMVKKVSHLHRNEERTNVLETFLLKQFRDIKSTLIEFTISEMIHNNGIGNIRHHATKACLSASRYRVKFAEEMGISPKVYQKLVRVNAVIKYYRKNPAISLTRLAYEFGYFDQSHFIRDFKSVTGCAPRTYFQNNRFLQF